MYRLFKTEWLKIKNYRTFWLLFSSFFIFFPVIYLLIADKTMEQLRVQSVETAMIQSMMNQPFIFPNTWHGAAWFGGLFFIILGMLFIMLITNEVQYRTHRQNIIDGWDRMDFLKAKGSLLIFFVLTSTAMIILTGLICGLIYTPDFRAGMLFENFRYIGYYMIMATLYLVAAFALAIFIKRTGLAIILYFAYIFIIDNLLWLSLTFNKMQAGYYLPLESSDSLIPNPFKPKMVETRTVPDISLAITAIVYGVLLVYLIVRYYKKADLKN